MALNYGLKAIQQGSADSLPHILAFATARATANDTLFEVWNGSTSAARKFRVELDGKVVSSGGAEFAGAVTLSSTLAVTGDTTVTGNIVQSGAAREIAYDGRVRFAGNTSLTFSAGTLYKSAANGVVLAGATGTSYDLLLATPSGAHAVRVPTGTSNVELPGTLAVTGAATFVGGVTLSGGSLTIPATAKLRLDGSATGDTFIDEDAANRIRFRVGGADVFRMTATVVEALATLQPNGARDLGASAARWSNVYGGNADLSGTLAVTGNTSLAAQLSLSGITTTTTATAGAATLPSNPVGYITVTIAGTARKIPYYAS